MQSIEQHYYRETEEQNSNGCKLLVKEDAMLDSLDARERSYDNSANGINFTIRKVNLMFFFIVVVWIFFFNKYMIQNPVFFVYNVIMLSIVYAIVLSTVAPIQFIFGYIYSHNTHNLPQNTCV